MKIVIIVFLVSTLTFLSTAQIEELDTTKTTYIPFIDQLENNDSYTIKLDSYDCFHHKKYKLSVKRKKEKYYIRYHLSSIELDIEARKYIHDFEVSLSMYETHEEQIIPSDFYIISTKGRTVRVNIERGSDDFYYLMDNLKLIESKGYE